LRQVEPLVETDIWHGVQYQYSHRQWLDGSYRDLNQLYPRFRVEWNQPDTLRAGLPGRFHLLAHLLPPL